MALSNWPNGEEPSTLNDRLRFKMALVDHLKTAFCKERVEFREKFILGALAAKGDAFILADAVIQGRQAEEYIFGSVPDEE